MSRMFRQILAGCMIVLAIAATPAAFAQRLISTLSLLEVSIDSNFTGESLTLFGSVEPDIGAVGQGVVGPFDIIIVIHGPNTDRVVRRKARQFGVWLNRDGVTFANVPSFYHILSSQPLDQIISNDLLAEEKIGFSYQVQANNPDDSQMAASFSNELIRLMTDSDMFGLDERHVLFLSPRFYKSQLNLPADVPNGSYLAKTYLVRDGEIIDQRAERFLVRTAGIERVLSSSATSNPLLYGLACVALALLTGWIGSVAFRR